MEEKYVHLSSRDSEGPIEIQGALKEDNTNITVTG
jgi:hypothetical protein